MTDFKFEIKKYLGVIYKYENGWTKELNIISWCEGPDKYDIRDWDENHEKMSRGVTLTHEQFMNLKEIMEVI